MGTAAMAMTVAEARWLTQVTGIVNRTEHAHSTSNINSPPIFRHLCYLPLLIILACASSCFGVTMIIFGYRSGRGLLPIAVGTSLSRPRPAMPYLPIHLCPLLAAYAQAVQQALRPG